LAATTDNALVIAPQWIGDAVMTEPLLRRLAARGERLTVGALPWVAPVYRAMPAQQLAEALRLERPALAAWLKASAEGWALEGDVATAPRCEDEPGGQAWQPPVLFKKLPESHGRQPVRLGML
jgi:hypothetical protein